MRRAERRGEPVFSILTVCHGNICRSPLAEQLLRARFAEAGIRSIEVASAGLGAVVGAPMEPVPAELSRHYGADPAGAVGRQLGDRDIDAADLVLTMTVGQRNELVSRYPRASQRTFTIIEFARLLATLPDEHPVDTDDEAAVARHLQLVGAASRRRSMVRLTPADDVIDPMGRSRAVHESVAEQLSLTTSRLVFGLR